MIHCLGTFNDPTIRMDVLCDSAVHKHRFLHTLYMSEHAATLLSRYQVGTDDKTPYKTIIGKSCKQPVVEFGEQVLAKPMRKKQT